MTIKTELGDKVTSFLYKVSEDRGLFRAGHHYDLADREKRDLESLGVTITDLGPYSSKYEFKGHTWRVVIVPKESLKENT